jgi:NDP-sugar pyrophosphorylase family protein
MAHISPITLVCAAGRGTRLLPITENLTKSMIPVGDRPLIQYSLDNIASSKRLGDVVIVIGHLGSQIENYVPHNLGLRRIHFVIQDPQRGLVDAILSAEEFLTDPFFLMLGDEILPNLEPDNLIELYESHNPFAICGVVKSIPEEVKKTYSVTLDGLGRIITLVEKPKAPNSFIKGTGNCLISRRYLSYAKRIQELAETDFVSVIQYAISLGEVVLPYFIDPPYWNVNTPEDLEEARNSLRRT